MAAIIIPSRRIWTQQPASPVEIDWSHPLARGLIFACIPGAAMNLADAVPLFRVNVPFSETIRRSGRVISAGAYYATPPTSAADPSAKFDLMALTALIVASIDSATNAGNNYSLSRAVSTSVPPWGIGINGASGVRGTFGGFDTSAAISGLDTRVPHAYVLRGEPGRSSVWVDGERKVENTTYLVPKYAYTGLDTHTLRFGTLQSGGTNQRPVRPALGLVWQSPLSDRDIRDISANPWQIFRPPVRRTFFLPTSGGATPVSSSLTDTWTVRGSAQSSLPDTWAIRAAVQSSLTDTWEILSPATVESRLAVSWLIRAAVQSSLTDSWRIGDLAPLTPDPCYLIRAARRYYLIGPRGIHMISAKDPAEIITVTFDFSHLADAVSAPVVTCNLARGLPHDDIPDMLLGAPEIIGRRILQRLTGGQAGNSYRLRCQIDDADGERWVVAGVMPVRRA